MMQSTIFRSIVIAILLGSAIHAGWIQPGHWFSTLLLMISISLVLYSYYGVNFKRGMYHSPYFGDMTRLKARLMNGVLLGWIILLPIIGITYAVLHLVAR